MEKDSLQIEFNRLVNRGIVLGYTWILGAGSIIALVSAYQANKIYKQSGNGIEGKENIRKCFYIGVSGLLVWAIAFAIIFIFKKK